MSFSPVVFGTSLARILDLLAAIQTEESKRFNRQDHMPLLGIFTNPSGTWFEADMLTRHFYAGQMGLDVALAQDLVPGAREAFEWQQGSGSGVTMLQVRQMLLMRYVEMASALQPGPSSALPAVRATARQQGGRRAGDEWEVGRWALRPTEPAYGMLWPSDARPPPQEEGPPPGMQPAWSGPVMMAIPFVQPGRPEPTAWPQQPRPAQRGQFTPAVQPLPPPERTVPLSPSEPASSVQPSPVPESGQASPPQPPAHTTREAQPRPPPRREPGWLMQDSDASMQSSPASPAQSEPSRPLPPPGMLATPWFPQPPA